MINEKKVCIFTLYCKEGASSNFRILMFEEDLKQKFKVKSFSFWNKNYVGKYMINKKKYLFPILLQYIGNVIRRIFELIFIAPKYDVVIMQKGAIPGFFCDFIKYLHRKNCKVVFDVDDAIYTGRRDNSDRIASKVDYVVVGNDVLKEHYEKFNKSILKFPTVDYTPGYVKYIKDTFPNKCIGWIGSKATIDNLDIVVNAINNVIIKHPEVKVEIISNTADEYDRRIKNCNFIQWKLNEYKEDMSNFTIGIMPLNDNVYNRGKCGFKLIQYMNMKKPVIASGVGVNAEIVGNAGVIANSEEEWENALETLLFDPKSYEKSLKAIESEFESNFSYEFILMRWIDLLERI